MTFEHGSPDEARMNSIALSMMEILELAGGRHRAIREFGDKRDSFLSLFHKIGTLSTMVSEDSKSSNSDHINWQRLTGYHPDSLPAERFTEDYLANEISSECLTEPAIAEMGRSAGWYLEQEHQLISDLEAELRERTDGWRMRVNRSYWWMASLGFILLFLGTTSSSSEISWALTGGELGLAALTFLAPTTVWAWIVLSAPRLDAYHMSGHLDSDGNSETLDRFAKGRRNPIVRQRRQNLTQYIVALLKFLKKQRGLYKSAQSISAAWLIFLIVLLSC